MPVSDVEKKINVAVTEFLLKYMWPTLDPQRVFEGNQNNMALPGDEREHTLFYLSQTRRIGTNTGESQVTPEGNVITATLREYVVTVDFCDTDIDRSRSRAEGLETLSRSAYAADFFHNNYDIGLLYAENMVYLPYVDDTNQFINRFQVKLHLSMWSTYSIEVEYFERASVTRLENVDVHHPPTN